MGEKRDVFKTLVGKPEGKRQPERRKHRREGNIELELREMLYGGMDWIDLAQKGMKCRAFVNTVINLVLL
jgi:hypothetical protein